MCVVNGENGYVERITGNPLHVLGVVQHALIIWNLLKSSLKNFSKCRLVVHALVSWTTILRLDGLVIHGRVLFMQAMFLLAFSPLKAFWTWSSYG